MTQDNTATVEMNGELLTHLLTKGKVAYEVVDGIPPDAKLVGVSLDRWTDTVKLVYRHDAFTNGEKVDVGVRRTET